jgi:hypothetical protein
MCQLCVLWALGITVLPNVVLHCQDTVSCHVGAPGALKDCRIIDYSASEIDLPAFKNHVYQIVYLM